MRMVVEVILICMDFQKLVLENLICKEQPVVKIHQHLIELDRIVGMIAEMKMEIRNLDLVVGAVLISELLPGVVERIGKMEKKDVLLQKVEMIITYVRQQVSLYVQDLLQLVTSIQLLQVLNQIGVVNRIGGI